MEHEERTESSVETSQLQPKEFHLNKWHVITVALIAVIAIQAFLHSNLNARYNTLNANQIALTSDHQSLTNDYDTLTNQYSALQSTHNTLQDSYDSLQTDYSLLQSSYNSYVSSYGSLRERINQRILQFNVTDFITPYDPAVQNVVSTTTGGWSNTDDWDEFWVDVKVMYEWVVNNIEYRSDGLFPTIPATPSGSVEFGQEMWQLPQETLDLEQGDCEDMVILLTSMIRFYNGEKYWAECVGIEGSISAHAGVQIPVAGDKLTILDPAGNYYTQTSGYIDSKDTSTEINNWLDYWNPEVGNDVHVDRVFSSYIDTSFSSTSEYLTWMNSR